MRESCRGGAASGAIKIGGVGPLTGDAAIYGNAAKGGAEIAVEEINALGIGPQGLGGRTTALSAAILTQATHIAGLPCAVNLGCHVTRHAHTVL